jgi:hypothetical protein
MPSLLHATPKYRLHRSSGQAVVTLSGADHISGPLAHEGQQARILTGSSVSGWPMAELHPEYAVIYPFQS